MSNATTPYGGMTHDFVVVEELAHMEIGYIDVFRFIESPPMELPSTSTMVAPAKPKAKPSALMTALLNRGST